MSAYLLIALACLALGGCTRSVELRSGLTESDANDIVAALLDAGVSGQKKSVKDNYSVVLEDDSQLAHAVNVIRAAGLPRNKQSRMGEVFKKDGMISSPLEERGRYLFALSQELEHTLSEIDGVLTARVHIVLPERVAPGEPVSPSSAAVFIKYRPGVEMELQESRIRRMVAASIPGLAALGPESIAVVFVPAMEQTSTGVRGTISAAKDFMPAPSLSPTPATATATEASSTEKTNEAAAQTIEGEKTSASWWIAVVALLASTGVGIAAMHFKSKAAATAQGV